VLFKGHFSSKRFDYPIKSADALPIAPQAAERLQTNAYLI
jgi:hypothetical protein